jgi:hypothetical protein
MAEASRARTFFTLLKNLTLAALLYATIYGILNLVSDPSVAARGKIGIPAFLDKAGPTELIKTTKSGIQVKFAGTDRPVTINPHANVFNRPVTAVKIKDDYLGPRPHVDTEADLNMLIEECRGTYEGLEKMRKPYDCLKFFAEEEERYYHLPNEADRASKQDPREADYINADGHGKTLQKYISVKEAVAAQGDKIGTCPGPIIPYHVYWTGPATWRVEVFIKSYLYTQNLACSRLWLWLDSDRNPNAVENMLTKDALFARFLPLVDRGDVVVKAWNFPSRIPMPKDTDDKTGFGYWSRPGSPNSVGEKAVADNIIEDKDGQQWLVLTPKQMTFLPVAVSDAVRFIVLHMYGGAYFDMDVLMLRDMRPLLLPKEHAFAERWGAHAHPGEYNTAIMSLSANSSLSSYLLFVFAWVLISTPESLDAWLGKTAVTRSSRCLRLPLSIPSGPSLTGTAKANALFRVSAIMVLFSKAKSATSGTNGRATLARSLNLSTSKSPSARNSRHEQSKMKRLQNMPIRPTTPTPSKPQLTRRLNCATKASCPTTFSLKTSSRPTIARYPISSVVRGHTTFTTR